MSVVREEYIIQAEAYFSKYYKKSVFGFCAVFKIISNSDSFS